MKSNIADVASRGCTNPSPQLRLPQESTEIASVFNCSDECFSCHYPIFNPPSCELLRTVGAHTTWLCHLSGVWIKRNVNISAELQATAISVEMDRAEEKSERYKEELFTLSRVVMKTQRE